jgi:hypothetical protein
VKGAPRRRDRYRAARRTENDVDGAKKIETEAEKSKKNKNTSKVGEE